MNFDTRRYQVYTWKHWVYLHWILNPGMAVMELLMGVRIPKVALKDKTLDKPLAERSFVPCPHCGTMHDSRTWSYPNKTASKNWFGLYCPHCGGIIPCILNATSMILLVITAPIWYWFRSGWKRKWLERQPERYRYVTTDIDINQFEGTAWIGQGLGWGVFMFVILELIFPWFSKEPITWPHLLAGSIIWTLGGLGWGYTMKLIMGRRGKTKT